MNRSMGPVKAHLAAAVAVVAAFAAVDAARAKKAEPDRLKLSPGQAWSLEDTLLTRITDPQTGAALTPSVKGVFRYKVESTLSDGSSVVSVKVVSLRGGPSLKKLTYLPVDHPERPEQDILVTPEGRLYGPYPLADRERLSSAMGGTPWVWYKLPDSPLEAGSKVTRKFKDETWDISRLDDETVGGAECAVYEARLKADAVTVMETTWFDRATGSVLKRELSEKRAKGVWSTLSQVRL